MSLRTMMRKSDWTLLSWTSSNTTWLTSLSSLEMGEKGERGEGEEWGERGRSEGRGVGGREAEHSSVNEASTWIVVQSQTWPNFFFFPWNASMALFVNNRTREIGSIIGNYEVKRKRIGQKYRTNGSLAACPQYHLQSHKLPSTLSLRTIVWRWHTTKADYYLVVPTTYP